MPLPHIQDGKSSGGVALIAYPAQYKLGGVMTFIIGADGKVYQKNPGEKTADVAAAMSEYDPANTWKRVTV